MKYIIALLCGILVASNATAATHTYNWQTGYGHWNQATEDIANGTLQGYQIPTDNTPAYSADTVIFHSNLATNNSNYWQEYFIVENGTLRHIANGFSVDGGQTWHPNGLDNTIEQGLMNAPNLNNGTARYTHEDPEIQYAYDQGWTGQHMKVSGGSTLGKVQQIAQGWALSHCCGSEDINISRAWRNQSDVLTFTSNEYIKAGKTAIVWSKFIDLNGTGITTIMESSDYNLYQALSPVGLLQ